jgi:hypothetical protein
MSSDSLRSTHPALGLRHRSRPRELDIAQPRLRHPRLGQEPISDRRREGEDPSSYCFDGSLTTPPCTEGVKGVVLTQPAQLSAAQIAAFHGRPPGRHKEWSIGRR